MFVAVGRGRGLVNLGQDSVDARLVRRGFCRQFIVRHVGLGQERVTFLNAREQRGGILRRVLTNARADAQTFGRADGAVQSRAGVEGGDAGCCFLVSGGSHAFADSCGESLREFGVALARHVAVGEVVAVDNAVFHQTRIGRAYVLCIVQCLCQSLDAGIVLRGVGSVDVSRVGGINGEELHLRRRSQNVDRVNHCLVRSDERGRVRLSGSLFVAERYADHLRIYVVRATLEDVLQHRLHRAEVNALVAPASAALLHVVGVEQLVPVIAVVAKDKDVVCRDGKACKVRVAHAGYA